MAAGVMVLRLLTMSFGLVHVVLVFLSLRLLFPAQIGRQMVGLVLAAFLPMQLYLSHYVTNETLAATLASATIYLCLRLVRAEKASVAGYAGLGSCLGAALLTKVTSILLVPFIVVAVAGKLLAARSALAVWWRDLGRDARACFAVCGWYYLWIWLHFGTPLVGNWDAASGFRWWQDNGYHTLADFLRFGRSLVYPLFSSFSGFWDGIYSTLWGDGLCGGRGGFDIRPPWNYNLMIAGYLLALVPTSDHPGRRGGFGLAVHSPTIGGMVCAARFFGNVVAGTDFHEPEGALLCGGESILRIMRLCAVLFIRRGGLGGSDAGVETAPVCAGRDSAGMGDEQFCGGVDSR